MTDEQSVGGKRRRTPAEIEQIVCEFESSGLNRSQFCRRQSLTLGVLNRYLQRRHAASGSGASGDGLVGVELAGKKLGAARLLAQVLQHVQLLVESFVSATDAGVLDLAQ